MAERTIGILLVSQIGRMHPQIHGSVLPWKRRRMLSRGELVALAIVGALLAGETALQHIDAFVHQRNTP